MISQYSLQGLFDLMKNYVSTTKRKRALKSDSNVFAASGTVGGGSSAIKSSATVHIADLSL